MAEYGVWLTAYNIDGELVNGYYECNAESEQNAMEMASEMIPIDTDHWENDDGTDSETEVDEETIIAVKAKILTIGRDM